jgi:hypothetical protein
MVTSTPPNESLFLEWQTTPIHRRLEKQEVRIAIDPKAKAFSR